MCDELKSKQDIIDTIIAHNTTLLKSLHPPPKKTSFRGYYTKIDN